MYPGCHRIKICLRFKAQEELEGVKWLTAQHSVRVVYQSHLSGNTLHKSGDASLSLSLVYFTAPFLDGGLQHCIQ